MLFSILIPVYNVDKYLSQCLDSVLSQMVIDFEVILVNDGSTDNSDAICREYSMKDQRIRYFSKTNEGLLLTRRYSLQYAKGDYVLFLDSDDYWQPNILSVLKNEIERDRTIDMIIYRYNRVNDNGQFLFEDKNVFLDREVFTPQNLNVFIKEFVSSSRLNTMWSKCVKRDIIDIDTNYSRFCDVKGEDLLQSITLIQKSKKILYLDSPLLNYRLSPSGRGRNFKIKNILDLDTVRYYVYEKLQEMNVSEDVYFVFYNRYIDVLFSFLKKAIGNCHTYKEYKQLVQNVGRFKVYCVINEDTHIDMSSNPKFVKLDRYVKKGPSWLYFAYYKLYFEVVPLVKLINDTFSHIINKFNKFG